MSDTTADTTTRVTAALRAAGCVFAEQEAALLVAEASSPDELSRLLDRRVAGEPLEYVVGWARFHGVRVAVEPPVFVPRRRTELVADLALAALEPGDVLVDLCCGSGAIGRAVLTAAPTVEVYAADVDPAAVRCARRNLPAERVLRSDLFFSLPVHLRRQVVVIAVNAPYVPTAEIATLPPEARLHEAPVALDGGPDGLDLHRRIAAGAADWLRPGGQVLIECGRRQAPASEAAFARHGFVVETLVSDDLDATVVRAALPPPT